MLTLLLLLNVSVGKAGEYNFRNYSNKDGLSHNTVFCSLQDSRGYMWFGTEDGLNRFDGYTFQVYKHAPEDSTGLTGNCIQFLCEDSSGKIWICTTTGLCYYDYPTDSFVRSFPPFEDEQHIYFSKVKEDREKNIWFIRGGQIVVYSPGNQTTKHFPSDEYFHPWNVTMSAEKYPIFSDGRDIHVYQPSTSSFNKIHISGHIKSNISTLCEIPDIGILIGTERHGVKLYRYHNQEIEDITPFTQVRDITPYSRNVYWIGTESGIYIYDVVNRTLEHLTKSLISEYTISDNAVYSITRDIEGGGCG